MENTNYNNRLDNSDNKANDNNLNSAIVISEHKGSYVVKSSSIELIAKITGTMLFKAESKEDLPIVGDQVMIQILDENEAVIHTILPRKNILARKSITGSGKQTIAANIDFALIVQAPDRDYSLNRFERYITIAKSENIKPILVLNKTDLLSKDELDAKIHEIQERFDDVKIYTTSTITNEGIEQLKNGIKKGQCHCFLGSSGVGKSSLINLILGKNIQETADISSYANRGKHITTHRELFILDNGAMLIDNPGMREIGILDVEAGINDVFGEIYELSKECRFSNCSHINEPGCAVLKAISDGILDEKKYKNYLKMIKENEYNTSSQLERRKKDKKFGQFVRKIKKQINKH